MRGAILRNFLSFPFSRGRHGMPSCDLCCAKLASNNKLMLYTFFSGVDASMIWSSKTTYSKNIIFPTAINTRVALKPLTPPLGFWTLDEIKHSVHGKVKREVWTGEKGEKVGQLCPSTETGAVQGWAMVDSWYQLLSFNQSINQWLHHHVKQWSYQKTLLDGILPTADILHWITQDWGLN